MTKTMLNDSKISDIFWTQAIHNAIHTLKIGQIKLDRNMTPYEIWKHISAMVKHFRVFDSRWYIKINDGSLGKFDFRADEGIFLRYSTRIKAYKFYKLTLEKMVESPYVKVEELFMDEVQTWWWSTNFWTIPRWHAKRRKYRRASRWHAWYKGPWRSRRTRRRITKTWYKGTLHVCLKESFRVLNSLVHNER